VNRGRARVPRGLQDPRAVEIALARLRRADLDRLVGEARVQRSPIRRRVDRDRAQPSRRAVRITRQAISPRFAINTLSSMGGPYIRKMP